jgi:hypothetical protein
MALTSQQELVNTKRKLALLERAYEEAMHDTEDEHVRDLELESLKRLINQFKEEIVRYEAHRGSSAFTRRELKDDVELANTRRKLAELEAMLEEDKHDPSIDEELREVTTRSIQRLANQLKEEIIRYEAHQQPARR